MPRIFSIRVNDFATFYGIEGRDNRAAISGDHVATYAWAFDGNSPRKLRLLNRVADEISVLAPGVQMKSFTLPASAIFATRVECRAAFGSRIHAVDVAARSPADQPRKRGRPRSTVARPQRTLGRVAEADWQTLQEAARIAGQTFTEFALSSLLPKARRLIARA